MGMFSLMYVMNRITEQLKAQVQFLVWTDNAALVRRVTKMVDYDPVAMNLKSNPDL